MEHLTAEMIENLEQQHILHENDPYGKRRRVPEWVAWEFDPAWDRGIDLARRKYA